MNFTMTSDYIVKRGRTLARELQSANRVIDAEVIFNLTQFMDEYDPTPWCDKCGARCRCQCKCGPLADND